MRALSRCTQVVDKKALITQGLLPLPSITIETAITYSGNKLRTNLKVPFAEKEEAKKLGARWDATRKIWYVEDKEDLTPFSRWAPSPHASSDTDGQAGKPPAAKTQTTGKAIVGSAYHPLPRICQCLPWEVCDQCKSTALSN